MVFPSTKAKQAYNSCSISTIRHVVRDYTAASGFFESTSSAKSPFTDEYARIDHYVARKTNFKPMQLVTYGH